ncbi:MAG: 4Fe-4S binding protein [Gammaproteobacteria bacterium]|nr:4Fe-4S binding protein [Gammaproteobacteria bacterium]
MLTNNSIAIEAALNAACLLSAESTSLVSYQAKNHVLIIGSDDRVTHVVNRLHESMLLVVLITRKNDAVNFDSLDQKAALAYGELSGLTGHLGAYLAELEVAGKTVNLIQVYHSEQSTFDMVIDLSAEPVMNTSLLPFGYFTAKNDLELEEVIKTVPDMTGEFEKPKFFEYNADICAHGNSGLKACQRCIQACPAGAISSLKDKIEVDPFLCQGGGVCATVCPAGAIQYVYPRLQDTLKKLRYMLKAYHEAGGQQAVIVFYGEQETPLMDALGAQSFIPVQLEETASVGIEVWLTAFAYGAHEVVLLTHKNTASEVIAALDNQLIYAHEIITGMGLDANCLQRQSIDNDTSPQIQVHSNSFESVTPATYMALNDKRSALRLAVDHLYKFAPAPAEVVALTAGAPFGEILVDKEKCTLCMACVSVCPGSALEDGKDLPQLKFKESNCVQCGLCSSACPEIAITLSSRYNYSPNLQRQQRLLNEEAPFCCIGCGKPFATHKMISNITEKLSGHSMYQSEEAMNRLKMCEDCRVRDMFSNELEQSH